MTIPEISWLAVLPTLIVTSTGIAILIADIWTTEPDREGLGWIGILGLLVAAVASALLWTSQESAFGGTYALDRYALFFNVLFCLATVLTLLLSMDYLPIAGIRFGEYYALTVFAAAGMVMMAAGTDLIILFLGLEVMSIAVYPLAGMLRRDPRSNEAALKYFLLGAFASGFLLFGIALLYGACSTTRLEPIAQQWPALAGSARGLAHAGLALLLVGFGFKIAAVPFHGWAPDVYEGAPTSVTAFMAVAVKAAAFAALARVFLALGAGGVDWSSLFWVLAALTMTVGNVVAIAQSNIKRMLAYSSIAHAGYLLVGIVAGRESGGAAVLYYLLVYALMNLGAFAVVIALGRRGDPKDTLDDYRGVSTEHPFLAASMTVFMFSLAGIPTLAGFTGKFYLFSAAVESGYVGLALVGVINSVLSMYYYIGIPVRMYMTPGSSSAAGLADRPCLLATVLLTLVGTIALGIFPSWAYELARAAYRSLV